MQDNICLICSYWCFHQLRQSDQDNCISLRFSVCFNTSYHSQWVIHGLVTASWGRRRALSSAHHDTYSFKFWRTRRGISGVLLPWNITPLKQQTTCKRTCKRRPKRMRKLEEFWFWPCMVTLRAVGAARVLFTRPSGSLRPEWPRVWRCHLCAARCVCAKCSPDLSGQHRYKSYTSKRSIPKLSLPRVQWGEPPVSNLCPGCLLEVWFLAEVELCSL